MDKLHAAPPPLRLTTLPLRPLATTLVIPLVTPLVTPWVTPLPPVLVLGEHTDGGWLVGREGGEEAAQGHAVYH